MMAYSPEGQRLVSGSALSHGGSRERSGRGEFFAVPQDWSHLDKSRKRQCGLQKPTTLLNLNHILWGVPREKARSEPVGSAPPTPRRCLSAARLHHTSPTSPNHPTEG